MISVEEALSRLLEPLEPLPPEQVSIVDALGRVLAEDVAARRTQPPFAVSAMDGYAVRAEDVITVPVELRIVAEVPSDRLVGAESGIRRSEDLDRLAAAGARCFLVGETLLRERDLTAATRRLLRLPTDLGFTHLDAEGRARMVDISDKQETERVAIAGARVVMRPETLERIRSGEVAKGDVLAVARLAGIMAAKRTPELIPLCHPLALTSVNVDLQCVPERSAVEITATCKLRGRTGVEMEALTAASVAALTVYDMCKAVDRGMVVTDLRLLRKWGGKSGNWEAER